LEARRAVNRLARHLTGAPLAHRTPYEARLIAVSSALVGVIGVAAGALATGGIQAFLSWRSARADAVASARLMWAEFRSAGMAIRIMLERDAWMSSAIFTPTFKAWETEKRPISRATTNAEFRKLARAIAYLQGIRIWEIQNESFQGHREDLEEAAEAVARARVAAYVAGERPVARIKHRRQLKKAKDLYEPDVPVDQTALPSARPDEASR
jgi:hypothetical protein